ncbi:hypothetical protein IFM89_010154 [Coptis chinensis]|uniref:Uncharacterized protein n=1 Tax=Coptis chinensis TaxID=261450 RepID=A0A835IBF6_9MAGN|nr:hypothetical protein IFM89_010154 [Coptis chinensis]
MMAEQPLNAKFVVEELEVGLRVPLKRDEIIAIDREVICDVVKELMESENGKTIREKAEALGKLARQVVHAKGGSSYEKLNDLIQCLCKPKDTKGNGP